jgi:hypothetical protein
MYNNENAYSPYKKTSPVSSPLKQPRNPSMYSDYKPVSKASIIGNPVEII